jgi:hypothetical protein
MAGVKTQPLENDYKWREIDLTAARTDEKIFDEGISLTVVRVGTGTWSIKFNSVENDSIDSAELSDGDVFELEFSKVFMTNTSQTVTNPIFYLGRRG